MMIITEKMLSAKPNKLKNKWETPPDLFNAFNKEFNFTLDPCCEKHTAKCKKYYTKKQDGLKHSWSGETVFVNPPYSKGNIAKWMKKCYEESLMGVKIVALIPVSTSSAWFHDYVLGKAEIKFIRKRIKFVGAKHTAPFSSCIAIYN